MYRKNGNGFNKKTAPRCCKIKKFLNKLINYLGKIYDRLVTKIWWIYFNWINY